MIEVGIGLRALVQCAEGATGIGRNAQRPVEAREERRQRQTIAISALIDGHEDDQAVVPLVAANGGRSFLVRIHNQMAPLKALGDALAEQGRIARKRAVARSEEEKERRESG